MNQKFDCCYPSKIKSKNVSGLSSLLKITSGDTRLKILCILRDGEHCVCEIMEHVNSSQSLISHHLRDLKEAGIIVDQKRGLNVFYSLTTKGKKVTDLLFKIKEVANL